MLLVTGQTSTGQANTNGPITVLPFDPAIRLGNGIQFRALRVSPDGTVEDLTASAVWSSSNNEVAFVSQGFATGLNFGATIISAAAGSFTGHTVLTVGLFDSP